MRNTIVPFTVLLLLAAGCEPEREAEVTPQPRFADISVDIGSDAPEENGSGTRSLISVDAERFRDAYLFAFDAATGELICSIWGSAEAETIKDTINAGNTRY